jgi:glycosyltransferase involved in cell wall biosynthesis
MSQSQSTLGDAASAAPAVLHGVSAVITHHWLVRRRGGERVLDALCELLPDAPIYTLVHDAAGFDTDEGGRGVTGRGVRASLLNWLPGASRHYPKLAVLMPLAAALVRLPPCDLVLCSDAALAKAMRPHSRSRVVCYCYSPMRYVWEPEIARTYSQALPWAVRPLWSGARWWLRWADRRAARRVDAFLADSRCVAERIRRCYGRDSVVVYPPVDVPEAADLPGRESRDDYFLCVGHHTPYKRLDLALEACRRRGERLVIIGDGPELERLAGVVRSWKDASRALITFLGFQPDAVVRAHYCRARALLFPGEEDFGIVPVEAMGHGCPVIAYGAGGACETVIDGVTGVLFRPQTAEGVVAGMERAAALRFDAQTLHEQARQFNRRRFLVEMRDALRKALR